MNNLFVDINFKSVFIFMTLFTMNMVVKAQTGVINHEYIIRWKTQSSSDAFVNSNNTTRNSLFSVRRLMSQPMHLDLLIWHGDLSMKQDFLDDLQKNEQILHIKNNSYIESRKIPDDPEFPRQWQYINNGESGGVVNADLDMDLAWDITTGGNTALGDTIVVCVIDEGVNLNHPDLQGNMWVNHHEIPNNGIDDDGNGYIDDYLGWNVELENDNLGNGGSHGTPVSGIVGAKGNNGIGVSGVNWNVKIMFVDYFTSTEANVLASYGYVYSLRKMYNETNGQKGAYVVVTNASWGVNFGNASEATLWCELYDLLGEIGIINCAATTNMGVDVDIVGDLPTTCQSEFLISVTNMTRSDTRLEGAAFGRKSIDLGAFGHQTYTITRNGYGAFGGTSAASPHVAGAVGLLYSSPCPQLAEISKTNPSLAALVVKDMILHGVKSIEGLQNITTSGGRLNVHRSLVNVGDLCEECSVPAGIKIRAEERNLIVSWANDQSNENSIKVRFRTSEDGEWTTIFNIPNNYMIPNLKFCTEYEIQIGSDCGYLPTDFSYSKFVFTDGCCPKPKIIDILTFEDSVKFLWNALPGQNGYEVDLVKFGEEVETFQISDTFYVLENLTECSRYGIKLKASCERFSTISDFSEYQYFYTECGQCTQESYCKFGRKNSAQEWIEKFSLSELVNQSGRNLDGYGNYIGTYSTTLSLDSIYSFEIQPGFSNNTFSEKYLIFIDWNQDGEWADNEKVFDLTTSTNGPIAGLFQVPKDAKKGNTRLRVIMAFQNHIGACDDTGFEYGEIEDYCVEIIQNNCRKIKNIIIDSIQKESALLYYSTQDSSIQEVLLQLKKSDDANYVDFNFNQSPIFLDSLIKCTNYKLRLASVCDTVISEFSQVVSFKTLCNANTEEVASLSNIKIYPNPFENYIWVDFGLNWNFEKDIDILLFDVMGRSINIDILDGSGEKSTLIKPFEQLDTGLYFLRIGNILERKVFKVIKI